MALSGRPYSESSRISFPTLVGMLCIVLGSLATPLSVNGKRSIPIACHDFFFKVYTDSFNDTGVIQPAATYNISATYCPPTNFVFHRAAKIQLLLHGSGLNKLYWSALAPVGSSDQYQPYNYSYVDFARGKGYHTIAIDRLGAGNSSHPDPTLVRLGLEVEQTNIIIQQIRRRLIPRLPLPEKIILVGHSLGSVISSILLNKYPKAVDATILTGFSHVLSTAVSPFAQPESEPARDVFPSRFGNLDPGYVSLSNETSERLWFYSANGTFDPKVAALQYSREDVQAIGEDFSLLSNVFSGPYPTELSFFRGPLAIMDGQEDQPFCQGDCGTGNSSLVTLSQIFFPNVSSYTGFLLKDTGHLLQYHYSARKAATLLHEWLAKVCF